MASTVASILPLAREPVPLDEISESYRLVADERLNPDGRAALGQYMTPLPTARFMASLFNYPHTGKVRLLDPGAGVGSLTAAWMQVAMDSTELPQEVTAVCYEIEPALTQYLDDTLRHCRERCRNRGVGFTGDILRLDFIEHGTKVLAQADSLFRNMSVDKFTHCIMNPPYRKISSHSSHRRWLRSIGVETSNLYAGFLAIAIKLLAPGGELVAIVPRSFCNGPYFRTFRELLLDSMSITRLHVFDSRDHAFKDNSVLQENIIFHATKNAPQGKVRISTSQTADFDSMTEREAAFTEVVRPEDPQRLIHIATHDLDQNIANHLRIFTHSLSELGLSVSTGPVVDFRLENDLRENLERGAVPLIYSAHFSGHEITWPNTRSKKPNAIRESEESRKWLMPNDWYTLTKRFSSKEERRRIVAVTYDPANSESANIGIENHLNVFHNNGGGLDANLARGLAIYLNWTLIDQYFRQFNGHTQVNANDLRMLPYPDLDTLKTLGRQAAGIVLTQEKIDLLINGVVLKMSKNKSTSPANAARKIEEALSALKQLGLPKAQQNDRSALTLLALLNLEPNETWASSSAAMIGITPIMDFCKSCYGRNYAPNTRETFRRQTMHQFVQAGLVTENPDDPKRAINSPNWVYKLDSDALKLLRKFGTKKWQAGLGAWLKNRGSLTQLYAKARKAQSVGVSFMGKDLLLTPGRHNDLIKKIVETFVPHFASGSRILYLGDTGAKMTHFDAAWFAKLGLHFDSHGKFPDVVLYLQKKKWLLLIEAVTSHGPVNPKRHLELRKLFKNNKAGLIYVTAFLDRRTAARYQSDISWETEVWIAENPGHLVHFDGKRFLGPY